MKSPNRILRSAAKGLMNPPRPHGRAVALSTSPVAPDEDDHPYKAINDYRDLYRELQAGSVLLDAQGRVCEVHFDLDSGDDGDADFFLIPGVEEAQPLAEFLFPAVAIFIME